MLHVVPAQGVHLKTLLSSSNSASATQSPRRRSQTSLQKKQTKVPRVLAVRLHTFKHLTAKDMREIYNRAGLLNQIFSQSLEFVAQKRKSCKRSDRTLHARKVSFTRVPSEFNDHLQVNFLFIKEMRNLPILHMVDVGTGFWATSLMYPREMEDASRTIKTRWFDVHKPPRLQSSTIE